MSNRRDFIRKAALAGVIASVSPRLVTAQQVDGPFQPAKKRALRIAHITDVHMLDQPNANACFTRVLKELNTLNDKPDFIINTGDSVMDENEQTRETVEARWQAWTNVVKAVNKIPIHSALGNHDVWFGPDATLDAEYKKDKRYGKQWAIGMLSMPARYYAFEAKRWKFIALDSINGTNGYQLDDEQFTWLEKQLDATPANQPVLVFNHVPILSMGALLYYTKRSPIDEVKFPSGDMHNDHQRIKDLFNKKKNVRLALSGHVHYVDTVEYLGVKYMCNGAVSGNWWGNPIVLDEFPPVYTLIDLYEDGSSEHRLIYYNHAT